MAVTDFLGITLLEIAQEDKEVRINEAITALDTFLENPVFDGPIPASTQRALVSIGEGFAGDAGHFSGSASGTLLAMNAPAGFLGDLFVAQVGGALRAILDANGGLSLFGAEVIDRTDAGTTNRLDCLTLRHRTTGTAAAGFGLGQRFFLENASGSDVDAASMQVIWNVATAGSETTRIIFNRLRAGAGEVAFETLAGGYLHSARGFATGNSVAATTLAAPGTVTGRIEFFNGSGVSLGSVPLYANGSFS